ncbi:prominin-2 [Athene cunicularia]|uniref:prominin-2 n=1 Tax=Athene cunicularia TaxID=194338 RepID=UPI000EF74FA9|nr:prominin-2 [Athene cunicularia]
MRAAGLLLAWALLCPAGTQQCHLTSPSGVLRFTDTHAEIRVPALHRVPSSLDPLYGLVRHCLDLIQQNPLPTELLRAALNDPGSVRTSQVVQYELGYVVCAAVALLFTVAVPVAGMCFCYCRSRRQCGGRLRAHRRSLGCLLKALAGLPRSDFAEMIRQGNGTFNSIPELAVERMAQVIQDLRDEMARMTEKVQSIADSFPLPDYTQPVSEALVKAEDRSQPYLREVERFEHYRWIAGTVLCSIILLILACNVTGMALGAYGLSKREDPSDYECRGEAGAKFLLVGVGLAFLFSWLLILLVFATFLVGGNIQTLVCRNWVNQEIYKFIDTPGNLPPSMNLTRQLNLRRDSNLSAVYRECKSGAGLWEVLHLERSYDLDEHLKSPKYTADFQKRLGDFTARLGDVRLLRSEGRQDLETFAHSGVDEVDYRRFQEEMKNPVVQTSLSGLARSLEGLQKMQRNSTVAERLGAEARALWQVQNSTVQSQEALVAKMGESVQFLSRLAPHLQERVKTTLATIASVEARLPVQAQQILRQEIGCFTRKELRYFAQYLNWVGQTLREDVASCQPLATALDNGRVILCDRIADPWNAFWFSLGCCTFFLIPNIIFAVRLTKHFRPIRNRLISTGSEETCPFHIPRVTALKL